MFDFNKVKEIRKKEKLHIGKICSVLGIARETYWRWEKGMLFPSDEKIKKLANMLGVSVHEISDITEEISDKVKAMKSLTQPSAVTEYSHIINNMIKQLLVINEKFENAQIMANTVLNSIASIIYIKNNKQQYIAVNNMFLETLSLSNEYKVTGETDRTLFPRLEAMKNHDEDQKVLDTKLPITYEDFIPGSKRKKWGIISKIPLFDSRKKIAGLIGFTTDITEKKKFIDDQTLLNAYLENTNTGIVVYNADGKILYCNRKFADIVGYTAEYIYSWENYKDFIKLVHPDFWKSIEEDFEDEISPGKVRQYKMIRGNDKKEIWIELITSPNKKFQEQECFIAVVTNITDRKTYETVNELLTKSLESVSSGICIVNYETHNVFYINPAGKEMLYIENEVPVKNLEDLLVDSALDDDKKQIASFVRLNKFPEHTKYRTISKSGEIKTIDIKRALYNNLAGKYITYTLTDITEHPANRAITITKETKKKD